MASIKFQDIPTLSAANVTGLESVALAKYVAGNYYTYTLPIQNLLYTDSISGAAIKNGVITSNKLSVGSPQWDATGYFTTSGSSIDFAKGTNSTSSVISLGYNRTGAGDCYLNLYSNTGASFTTQISRSAGADGDLNILNEGAGATVINQSGAGSIILKTNNTTHITLANSNTYLSNIVNIGNETPQTSLWLTSNQINAGYEYNGTTAITFNFRGYNNGTTRFRDLNVYDGKENIVAAFTGSTKAVTVVGRLSSGGNIYGEKITGSSLKITGDAAVDGDLKVGNSTLAAPTGSAPIFGARACVNLDGTTSANGSTNLNNTARFIRGSGNVSSVVKTNTGQYDIIFTTPLPNVNYAIVGTSTSSADGDRNNANGGIIARLTQATLSATVLVTDPTDNKFQDPRVANIVFFG